MKVFCNTHQQFYLNTTNCIYCTPPDTTSITTTLKITKFQDFFDVPHRFTGVAEYADGTVEHFLNGDLHNSEGPAAIFPDGSVEWRRYGLLHNLEGPAVIWASGALSYCIEDIPYDKDDYPEAVKEYKAKNPQ